MYRFNTEIFRFQTKYVLVSIIAWKDQGRKKRPKRELAAGKLIAICRLLSSFSCQESQFFPFCRLILVLSRVSVLCALRNLAHSRENCRCLDHVVTTMSTETVANSDDWTVRNHGIDCTNKSRTDSALLIFKDRVSLNRTDFGSNYH
jgi:hypothetical protein